LQTCTFEQIQGHVWDVQRESEKQTSPLQILSREKKKKKASLEFHHLHVFIAASMKLLFVANLIVGNAI
jgi:hypothetical protein